MSLLTGLAAAASMRRMVTKAESFFNQEQSEDYTHIPSVLCVPDLNRVPNFPVS